jgi:DNA-binding NtrC family response regulator
MGNEAGAAVLGIGRRCTVMTQSLDARDVSSELKSFPMLRVLIVDDESLMRWSLAETLAEDGYDVVEAVDARGARAAIRDGRQDFDVVLLDYRLPDVQDLSLLATIRARSPRTQVILMTAFGTPELARRALDMGAFRVVSKPFEMQNVGALVGEAASASLDRA